MSNGGFNGIHQKLLDKLHDRKHDKNSLQAVRLRIKINNIFEREYG